MIDRFSGEKGKRLLVDALASQKLVGGNLALAEALADRCELVAGPAGSCLIEQGGEDNDVFLIVSGSFDVVVNGRRIARRGPGDHVGEMAAIQPSQKRSASVVAAESAVVAKLSEEAFSDIAGRYPELYRRVAQELARRLLQRNVHVGAYREKIRVFLMSSVEALPVARAIQNAFAYDPFVMTLWTDGCFKVASYTLQSLEEQIDASDFAVAIAHADDLTQCRGQSWPSPRDNVIFELGLFMGRLGRARAILMEPRDEAVKLPTDLSGLTTIAYRFEKGGDVAAMLAPACNKLRDHINALGANNG